MKPTLKRYRRKPSNKKHAKFLCKAVSTYSARRVGKVSTHRARRLKKEERRFHDHEIRVYIYVSSGSVAQSGCSTIALRALHHHTVRVLHHRTLWHPSGCSTNSLLLHLTIRVLHHHTLRVLHHRTPQNAPTSLQSGCSRISFGPISIYCNLFIMYRCIIMCVKLTVLIYLYIW